MDHMTKPTDSNTDLPATTDDVAATAVADATEASIRSGDAGATDSTDNEPRVIDEAAWAEENGDDDDDEDEPLHFGAVAVDEGTGDEGSGDEGADAGDVHEANDARAAVAARPDLEITLNADAEIPLALIDEDALWVVKRLRAKGFEAYLTGGCVRDLLLGRQPKDFDVATGAHPNQVRAVFRNCRLVGRRFRLAHVVFPSGKVIETATFRANPTDTLEDLPEDLLVARDNVFGNVEEDARRRDLTINGLFYDPVAGKVIDFVNGRVDLDARLIRTIGDPEIRFQEDPVRILRAIKFAARLGFDIEPATWEAMKRHTGGLLRCAHARLQEEILRLLASTHAATSFDLCAKAGVTAILLPEFSAALDTLPVEVPAPPAPAADVLPAETVAEPVAQAEPIEPVAATVEAVEGIEAVETAEVLEMVPERAPAPLAWPALHTAEARHQRLASMFAALDDVRRRDADITSALAFAVLVAPVWECLQPVPGAFDTWWNTTADAWTERIRLTRHDRERVPQLLAAQFDLQPDRRRGHQARATVGRPSFREALLLLTIRLHAAGLPLDEIANWKVVAASYGHPYQQPRHDRNRQRAAGRAPGSGSGERRGRGRDRDRDRDRGRGRSNNNNGGGGRRRGR
jgi:poly(A) polymerase